MKATTKRTKVDGEYRVRLFIDGEYQAGADYFTDCLQDAKDTAKLMEAKPSYSDKECQTAKDEQYQYEAEENSKAVELIERTKHCIEFTPRFLDDVCEACAYDRDSCEVETLITIRGESYNAGDICCHHDLHFNTGGAYFKSMYKADIDSDTDNVVLSPIDHIIDDQSQPIKLKTEVKMKEFKNKCMVTKCGSLIPLDEQIVIIWVYGGKVWSATCVVSEDETVKIYDPINGNWTHDEVEATGYGWFKSEDVKVFTAGD